MPTDKFAEFAKPRLLDQVRIAIRTRHYSSATEAAYVAWVKRFVIFHGKRHPNLLGEADVAQFPNHLATDRRAWPSTQNQALAALLFLYREVLGREISWVEGVVRARYRMRSPVILSRDEVRSIIAELNGVRRLVVTLLYGSGLPIGECLKLRVKDIDFHAYRIHVVDGNGGKDRVTLLPQSAIALLRLQLDRVHRLFEVDLARGYGEVYVPDAPIHASRDLHTHIRWRCRRFPHQPLTAPHRD